MSLPLFIEWSVDPLLLDLGPFQIRYYGLLFAMAFVIGYRIMKYVYTIEGLGEKDLDRITLTMIISVVVGARLGHVIFYEPAEYLANPIEIFQIWKGGLASHGGALGIFIGLYFYSRTIPFSYMWIMDRITLVVPTGAACIRLGNLFNSEIFGDPTSLPWGFLFLRRPIDGEVVPRHPTQIYEAVGYLLVLIVLMAIYKKYKKTLPAGRLFGTTLILMFFVRFIVEYFKVPQVGWENDLLAATGLNMGQVLSIPFMIAGAIILYFSYRTPRVPATA